MGNEKTIIVVLVFILLSILILVFLNEVKRGKEGSGLLLEGTSFISENVFSRAITAENKKGEKGQGGKTRNGRKGSPCLWDFKPGMSYTFAEIDGPGIIRHIWITLACDRDPAFCRNIILRVYWDGQEIPSIEAPITDFFGISHGLRVAYESAYLSMPEGRSFDCYFPMPFKKKAKFVLHNENNADDYNKYKDSPFPNAFFYQVDYTTGDNVTEQTPYFHAQFRRVEKTKLSEDYVILDGVKGNGRFIGVNFGLVDRYTKTGSWWGEGEVKMYIDGDSDYPSICGTGAEDYFCSAWGMGTYCHRYFGAPYVKGKYVSCYRFHILDPVYFNQDIKVTIQQMGNDGSPDLPDSNGVFKEFIKDGEYKKISLGDGCYDRVDNVCSTAYWYQTLPTMKFPEFPDKELRSKDLLTKQEISR